MYFYMRTGILTESMITVNRLCISGQLFKREISQNFLSLCDISLCINYNRRLQNAKSRINTQCH